MIRRLMHVLVLAVFLLPGFAQAGNATPVSVAEMTVSEAAPFVFGPGDRFAITVWRHTEMDMEVTIAPDGYITYPLVGRISAAGMTYPELVATLETGLSDYYTDVSVAVNVVEIQNQKVFVLGEVSQPAVLQVENNLTVLEALTRTGGINPDSRTDNVLLIRGGLETPELVVIDVASIYGVGDMSQMVSLQRGDIVYVPSKTITNVERFFRRIQALIAPAVAGTVVYRNSTTGGAQGASSALSQ